MRRMNIALACLLVLAVVACTSTSVYKTIASIEATVDTGMKSWGEWVGQQRAAGVDMTAKTTQVKTAYTSYRLAMNTVYEVRTTATSTNLNTQIQAATQAAVNLLNLVNTFLPATKQVSKKGLQ